MQNFADVRGAVTKLLAMVTLKCKKRNVLPEPYGP